MKRIVLAVSIFLLVAGGCKNPFSTRNDEEPTGRPGVWIPPTHPEDVLKNLQNAYLQENEANVLRCLSENFKFTAPEDAIENPPLFERWDRDVERDVTREIFNLVAPESLSIFLSFVADPGSPDVFEVDSATIIREYELIVEGSVSAPLSDPAQGWATFRLGIKDDGLWYIHIWRDDPPVPGEDGTWADLKVERWRP